MSKMKEHANICLQRERETLALAELLCDIFTDILVHLQKNYGGGRKTDLFLEMTKVSASCW